VDIKQESGAKKLVPGNVIVIPGQPNFDLMDILIPLSTPDFMCSENCITDSQRERSGRKSLRFLRAAQSGKTLQVTLNFISNLIVNTLVGWAKGQLVVGHKPFLGRRPECLGRWWSNDTDRRCQSFSLVLVL